MTTEPTRKQLTGQAAHRFLNRRQIQSCIFCGKAPLTKEHVWSRWLRANIPRHMTEWDTYKSTEYPNEIESARINRRGDPHDWQVRCVCGPCNNGWMSQIDNRVKPTLAPLVNGLHLRLTERDQSILSTWCVLKTMVAEFDDPNLVTIHHMQRRRMFCNGLPPKHGWRIWIGSFDRQAWVPYYINNTLSILRSPYPATGGNVAVKRYNTQSVTQVVGKLFIHIIHSPDHRRVSQWRFPPPVDGRMRQIWPLSGYSFVWPPDPMTDEIAEIAASAFLDVCRQDVARQRQTSITVCGLDPGPDDIY